MEAFLTHLARRVAAFTAEAELTVRDVRETHAGDELYSKADVEAMFDELEVAVRVSFERGQTRPGTDTSRLPGAARWGAPTLARS